MNVDCYFWIIPEWMTVNHGFCLHQSQFKARKISKSIWATVQPPSPLPALYSYGGRGLKPIMASLANIMLLYAQPVRITLAGDQIVMN